MGNAMIWILVGCVFLYVIKFVLSPDFESFRCSWSHHEAHLQDPEILRVERIWGGLRWHYYGVHKGRCLQCGRTFRELKSMSRREVEESGFAEVGF